MKDIFQWSKEMINAKNNDDPNVTKVRVIAKSIMVNGENVTRGSTVKWMINGVILSQGVTGISIHGEASNILTVEIEYIEQSAPAVLLEMIAKYTIISSWD